MEAIKDLGIDRFHAIEHLTGGCAAVEMPVRYADQICSLGLIGPVLVNEAERAEYRKTFVRPFAVEASGEFLKAAWDYLHMIGASARLDLQVRELADHLIAHATMPMAFSAVWDQDVEFFFRSVECPLVIMCSKDDVLSPLFDRAATMRPDARRFVVAGGDFQPDIDPEGVTNGIGNFLDTLVH